MRATPRWSSTVQGEANEQGRAVEAERYQASPTLNGLVESSRGAAGRVNQISANPLCEHEEGRRRGEGAYPEHGGRGRGEDLGDRAWGANELFPKPAKMGGRVIAHAE